MFLRFLTALLVLPLAGSAGCGADSSDLVPVVEPVGTEAAIRGGWLAPRQGFPLDSPQGATALAAMHGLGVRSVAVGHEVTMASMARPALEWGRDDTALRGVLRRIRAQGMTAFLLPRIESPDFFKPPYPFRADIDFAEPADWERFHLEMERMVLHYAKLAAEEEVAIFGLGLELKHSVRRFPAFWRGLARRVRTVFPGKVTYSANWYDEWQQIEFWDELDFIGVGAYFELGGGGEPGTATQAELVARWQPILDRLAQVSEQFDRPVLFTEVGYTGFADCAERPWEWAGKAARGIAIDHQAQARAVAALCRVVRSRRFLAGMYLWTFYTHPEDMVDWEYGIQGRPAEDALRRGYADPPR